MSIRVRLLLAAASLALAAFPVSGTAAQSPRAVRVDRIGWWSRLQPATGGLGLPVTITVPAPPTTPAGSAPVGAIFGEPVSVVAVGLSIDDPSGPAPSSITVRLPLAGAGTNDAAAVIVACPITEPWGPADDGPFDEAPAATCEGAPAGVRQADGSWVFEIPPAGRQQGVLLTAHVDVSGSFQVPFARDPAAATVTAAPTAPSGGGVVPTSAPSPAPPPAPVFDAPVAPAPADLPAFSPSPAAVAEAPAAASSPAPFRHITAIPLAAALLALSALATYGLASLAVGRRLHDPEVAT